MKIAQKSLLAAAAAVTLVVAPIAASSDAQAQNLLRLGVGAAAIGAGVVVGSNLANRAMNRNQGTTVVVQQQPRCYLQNQQVVNQFGQVIAIRQVQVCQ